MISVLLVDDDPLVRSALALMLGGRDDLRITGEAADGRQALAAWRDTRADIVLMDIRMPVMDGLEAARLLLGEPSPPKVIMLTTFDADEHVLAAVTAGADGFLLKDTPPAGIVAAVHAVAAGEPMLSPTATAALMRQARDGGADRVGEARRRLTVLTDRERDVARAIGRGLSNAEIAGELYLSVPTVKAHVSRLFEKLGTANRVQIAICVHEAELD